MAAEAPSSPLRTVVAFTGRLATMTRDEAFDLVRQRGGTPRRGVTRKTGVLIVGELGWPLLADGRPSKSLSLAKAYGAAISSERQFLEWCGRAEPDFEVKTYSKAQLSSLSGLAADIIERLREFGLISCRDGRYGFRDLAAARQLAQLFQAGVPLSTITRSLKDIRTWLPHATLSALRIFPASSDSILVEYMKGKADRRGQLVLPVDRATEDADELFEQAQAAEEAGDVESAERLYRKVMRLDPRDPAAAFNLGNLLRKGGRKVEAEAAYRAAVKADLRFAEAWYNLADLLEDECHPDRAVECLERALAADPDYADALFNLGLLHQRQGRAHKAAECWRHYLKLDETSPWAERARRALKYCEMQIALSS